MSSPHAQQKVHSLSANWILTKAFIGLGKVPFQTLKFLTLPFETAHIRLGHSFDFLSTRNNLVNRKVLCAKPETSLHNTLVTTQAQAFKWARSCSLAKMSPSSNNYLAELNRVDYQGGSTGPFLFCIVLQCSGRDTEV